MSDETPRDPNLIPQGDRWVESPLVRRSIADCLKRGRITNDALADALGADLHTFSAAVGCLKWEEAIEALAELHLRLAGFEMPGEEGSP